jgi:myo-inositol-1(or 4)-monophosphatase
MSFFSNKTLLSLSNSAISAALQAGGIIAKFVTQEIVIQTKTGGENLASQVLTEVDLLSQEIILETLLPTCNTFDIALLTEESDDDRKRLEKDYFWSIDPLDGTLPFIESRSGYAVSIALVSRSGIPFIGVIYDPVKKTLYHAIKDLGFFRNKRLWNIRPSSLLKKNTLTIISDRSFVQQNNYLQIMEKLRGISLELGFNQIKTIQHGGAAMNACWVLENSPACYFKFPKQTNSGGSLWDYAATACLFNEVGAYASDIYGEPLDLNRPDSTFMNHRGILYASHQKIADKISNLVHS